jgi:hypothetical protein
MEKKKIIIELNNKELKSECFETKDDIVKILKDGKDELDREKYVNHQIIIELKHDLLKEIEIYDSPGFNEKKNKEKEKNFSKVAKDLADKMDVIVFVSDKEITESVFFIIYI